jgi:choline dehydrogenase
MGNPRTDWCLKTEPEFHVGNKRINYPRGKVLGGCSSINGMLYVRGQSQDYDSWRQAGNAGWGWQDVLPHFMRCEDHFSGGSGYHGVGGELRVERQRVHWDLLDAFRKAAEQAGIAMIDDFNTGDNAGSSYFEVTQKSGWRWSAANAFLHPVRRRPNLRIQTNALVDRVIFEGKRAAVVQFKVDGQVYTARASGEIVLSSGAIGSPAILERSGVGDRDRLSALGIATVDHLPGVGENLQDHLQIRCAYEVANADTLNERTRSLMAKASIGLEYLVSRTGPLSMGPSPLGIFAKSNERYDTANLEFHIQPLSLATFGGQLDPFPAFTASVANIRPESRGSVHLKSANPDDLPMVQPNYLSTEVDRMVAIDSVRLARRVIAQPALEGFKPNEIRPGTAIQDDAEIIKAVGEISTTIFHPVGTAAMGQGPNAVVDSQLRVYGVTGLRVADASIMPSITSGNTNAPAIMIGEKAAAMMLDKTR